MHLGADVDDARLVEVAQASSPTFGMSRVIASGPSLVSRAMISNSSMWIEVNTSSRTMRSEIRMLNLRSCSHSRA